MNDYYFYGPGSRRLGMIRAESMEAARAAYAANLNYPSWDEIPDEYRPTNIIRYS